MSKYQEVNYKVIVTYIWLGCRSVHLTGPVRACWVAQDGGWSVGQGIWPGRCGRAGPPKMVIGALVRAFDRVGVGVLGRPRWWGSAGQGIWPDRRGRAGSPKEILQVSTVNFSFEKKPPKKMDNPPQFDWDVDVFEWLIFTLECLCMITTNFNHNKWYLIRLITS